MVTEQEVWEATDAGRLTGNIMRRTWSGSILQNRSNFNLLVTYENAMAGTFLQFIATRLMREMKWDVRRKIHDYVAGLVPEPVRKIVGLILIIFGVVVMFGTWTSGIFSGGEYEVLFMIGFIVSIASISWGIALLRHKG